MALKSFQAAVYLLKHFSSIDKRFWHVDFLSILKENQRSHLPPSAISNASIRGNRHIYGRIPTGKVNGKVVYERETLDRFIKHCKDNKLDSYMLEKAAP